MTNAQEPPDRDLSRVLDAFTAGRIDRIRAFYDIDRIFGGGGEALQRHLRALFDDMAARRVTRDEVRRDLIRSATSARRGEAHYLALLSPEHA